MRGDTYHQLGEHGVQFFGGRHGQSGLQALQGEAAVVAEAVRDLGVVAPFEAAENDGGQAPPATLAGRHGNGSQSPSAGLLVQRGRGIRCWVIWCWGNRVKGEIRYKVFSAGC